MVRGHGANDPADLGHVGAHQGVRRIALAQLSDGLELLLRPIERAASLREPAQQIAVCFRLP
eukprot:7560746-Alexandrium_andersonii.AAC.1